MKVRVLKEMPFAKIGKVFEVDFSNPRWVIKCGGVEYPSQSLLMDGWIEEVKGESLEDKFLIEMMTFTEHEENFIKLAKIAKEHYLEVFDKAFKPIRDDVAWGKAFQDYINRGRKAIEEA